MAGWSGGAMIRYAPFTGSPGWRILANSPKIRRSPSLTMNPHPEERRIAGLLRDLIVRKGAAVEVLEERLGWEPGRLKVLLDVESRLSFDDVLEILPLLDTAPADFFAWLYGAPGNEPPPSTLYELRRQRAMNRLFERSLRAVRSAVARRAAWQREQGESGGD